MGEILRAGARVAYEVRGQGQTILFAHNILCDRRVFDDVVAPLSPRYRTIAVDFRGHGQSDPPARPYGVRDLADDLVAVLDAEGVTRAHVVGLSIGAAVAMELALAYPGRVDRLVVMGATAVADPASLRLRNALLLPLVKRLGMRGRFATLAASAIFGQSFRSESPQALEEWTARMRALAPVSAAYALGAWGKRPRLVERLAALSRPTLVVIGEEDASCTPVEGERVHRAIRSSRRVRIARAGHALPAERPEAVTAAVDAFLAEGA